MERSYGKSSFDPARTYVRVVKTREDGFIEIEFAVGDPELFVEIILPQAAFEEFRAMNKATLLGASEVAPGEASDLEWRLRDATHKRLGN